jgi:hypothetical protein
MTTDQFNADVRRWTSRQRCVVIRLYPDGWQHDMQESADHAARAIDVVKERAQPAKLMLGLVLVSIGKEVRISQGSLMEVRQRPSVTPAGAVFFRIGNNFKRDRWGQRWEPMRRQVDSPIYSCLPTISHNTPGFCANVLALQPDRPSLASVHANR